VGTQSQDPRETGPRPSTPGQPPVFTKKIQPCRAFENTSARFEVEFDGDPLPKVTWYREDFPITSSPDLTVYTFSTKSILVLRQVFMEDSGVFSVVAENRGGTAKCSANLVVQERRSQARGGVVPPSFVTTIQSTTSNVGQLVRFDARINGTKPIDVYWLKNGKKITSDIRYRDSRRGRGLHPSHHRSGTRRLREVRMRRHQRRRRGTLRGRVRGTETRDSFEARQAYHPPRPRRPRVSWSR
jgi:hypothetical protein